MDFRLSRHASIQMTWRNVTVEDIDAVLGNPRWMPATTRGTRYDAIVDGERPAVVVVEGSTPLIVVTAFWPDLSEGRRVDR